MITSRIGMTARFVIIASLVMSLGCATFRATMYAHRTLAGAPFNFKELDRVVEGMSAPVVRQALGEPLEIKNAGDGIEWRYFERANPHWCNADDGAPPEYSIDVRLLFRN